MEKIKIITDSTLDLPAELYKENEYRSFTFID